MNPSLADLFEETLRRGVRFAKDGDTVRVTAPKPLPDDFKNSLRSARDEIAAVVDSDLGEYLTVLMDFQPDGGDDLPPVPRHDEPPARAIAWAAWWGAVEHCRSGKHTS